MHRAVWVWHPTFHSHAYAQCVTDGAAALNVVQLRQRWQYNSLICVVVALFMNKGLTSEKFRSTFKAVMAFELDHTYDER